MPKRPLQSICVFCGSRSGDDPAFLDAGAAMGRAIAERGLTLVYGGARVGVMGAVANAALAAGGRGIGVIPKALVSKEIAHDQLTELYLTESMHERKNRMIELSDAFVALPGGFGTYDELFETITLAQIGLHEKPNALLDTGGFFQPLIELVRHTIARGFAATQHEGLVVVDTDPARLLDRIAAWTPPPLGPTSMDRRGTP
ncbi:MAG TPA: TIGR00730 family Rossman fold protein [Labilithrix sp.]|nr:TIGR00730 family Rossman fold protein [Labilithrix sp.]